MSYTIEQYRISERRACRLAGISRSSRGYQPAMKRDDTLRNRIRELAPERQRFGHLRLTVLLRREGWMINHKKVYRICREEQLLVPRRRRRRLRRLPHAEQPVLDRATQSWAMDFMQDGLADGRTLRILTVIDRHTREALALEVDTSIPGLRVRRVLDRLAAERGCPEDIHVDNGLNASEKFEVSAEEVCSTQGMRAVGELSSSKGRVPEVVFHEVRDPAHHNEHKICAGAQP